MKRIALFVFRVLITLTFMYAFYRLSGFFDYELEYLVKNGAGVKDYFNHVPSLIGMLLGIYFISEIAAFWAESKANDMKRYLSYLEKKNRG